MREPSQRGGQATTTTAAGPPDLAAGPVRAGRDVSAPAATGRVAPAQSPAQGRRLGLALLVIATAQLMVVLDATIVNVALPHIQGALGFSGSGLEWVVNAYALTFGGFLLLGGRAGDLLGRRRMFVVGLLLFSAASLAGGLATTPAWLLAARAVQGLGGAIVAPAALSLIATTFPEGKPRSRAMGVYAAMCVAGGSVGLLAGGLLVSYVSWRWVLFVNVPIGIAAALAAPTVLPKSAPQQGTASLGRRFDLLGAVTATAGVAALVYGLSNAATSPNGVSHWGDGKVVGSLAAAAVLFGAFVLTERRATHPLVSARLLASRDRVGAYLAMLGVGTSLFGVFFFLTLFAQNIWGYSPLRTGLAFLPLALTVLVGAGTASQLATRVGARPLLLSGATITAGGLYWLSRLTEHASYAGGMLGPILLTGVGLGLLFVPLPLTALRGVSDADAGVASSLLNAGQQVGGSIGLAVLGTVAWTVVADAVRSHGPAAAAYQHALATGFDRAFGVAAGIMAAVLVVVITLIRGQRTG